MKRKRGIFTSFLDTDVKRKGFLVKRSKGGKLVDSFIEPGNDMPEEEADKEKVFYRYIYVFCFIALSILFFKILDLQLLHGDYFYSLAKGNRIRYQIVRAPRGLVFDNKGNPLVKNVANFQIVIEPFDLPKEESKRTEFINALSKDLEMHPDEINNIVSIGGEDSLDPKIIKDNIGQEVALKIRLKYRDFSAVAVEFSPSREYLDANLSHVIGYIGRISKDDYEEDRNVYDVNDYSGKNGLELSYEEHLKGSNGKRMVEVDAEGRVVRTLGSEDQAEAKMGNNLITSLDISLELQMVNALKAGMDNSGSKAGSVIAINPQNGNILGMVSLPSFDSNIFVKGIKPEEYKALIEDPAKPLFSRAVSGIYPPGSIIKSVIASAGLEEKVITPSTTIYDPGQLIVKNQYNPAIEYVFKDWKPQGHGTVNVNSAIAESCDIFFYHIGGGFEKFKGLGASRLEKYLKLFGLGSKSGIDLPNEVDGLVPTPDWKSEVKGEGWYTADNYHLAIGQGDLLATPLQAANFTTAVANGGILYKPRIVQKVTDQDGNIVKEFAPEVIRQGFINPNNIEIVRKGMRSTVTYGTARSLNSLPFAVAGKTGTAQFGPNNSKEHAWFTAFAPYDNPEIALVVLVEGGGEGNEVAVPVARQILEYYFSNK